MFRRSGWWTLALLALAVPAFWPGYFGKLGDDLPLAMHVHAAVATLWMALLVVQPFLVAKERRAWHRRVGAAAWVVAPLFVAAGLWLARVRFGGMPDAVFVEAGRFLWLPLSMTVMYALMVTLALAYRHQTALHARFMLGSALAMVDPVGARLLDLAFGARLVSPWHQVMTFVVVDVVFLLMAIRPRLAPQHARPYAFAVAATVALQLGYFTVSRTDAWFAVASAFAGR